MERRVLWVIKGLGPGGAERLLAAAARAHDRHRVAIECAYVLAHKDHLVGELEAAGVRCTCLSTRPGDRWWPWRLRRLVARGGFDVVHTHSPLPGSVARLAAAALPRRRRPVLVSTEHNTWSSFTTPTRWLNRATGRLDAATVAVSDEVARSMRGPAARRVRTLAHGIDVAAVAAARQRRAEVRAELGIGPDELVAVTVANYREQKDYPNLLGAAAELERRGVALRIVAVGQGPLEAEVHARRDELGLAERVVLTGYRPDATAVLGAADAFTLASAWEGLPVAVMEALAAGLPIVATAVGGVAECLRSGQDALLVPPGDSRALARALEEVAGDPELRDRLARAAAARAREFDVARSVAVLEGLYLDLTRDRAGEPEPPGRGPAPEPAPRSEPAPERATPGAGVLVRRAEPGDRSAILGLLRRSLGWQDDPRYERLYAWKHDDNPFGPSPAWVAVAGDRIVALRTFMRWEFLRGADVVTAVRAVDTATDPEHQGRGLFRALTLAALDELAAEGVAFVFNTPNAQSRPGYLKMGWREVGRLPAAVRVRGPLGAARTVRARVPAERWSQPLATGEAFGAWLERDAGRCRPPEPAIRELRTNRDLAYLRWRFADAPLDYRVLDDGDAAVVLRARRRGPATELVLASVLAGTPAAADRLVGRALAAAGADHVVRLGGPRPSGGFLPLPGGGPVLTWRALADAGMPPLPNWALEMGDVELF